ncbi:ChbG/HpnK family deacetylase [Granulicella paludicola]|jgi:predicted glycoside hydrolase/deacetylase ChbG (UPF0249 family)|uniref:ChbG/HpnK family deacetylase n=1 Tax=Granulicella paludicola TaxID=474951 RepID=UPI0021E0A9E1|nr:ChbG/HpnK family deacetylase [Granulicella paludicola]
MPARLILNADDFGLTPGVNRAIAELHAAGALTSATLMADGPAFDHAVAIARSTPTLGVGCHIVLTDGTPVSDPGTLPTLCPNGRTFRPSLLNFIRDLLLHRIDPDEIGREALAQFQKLERSGIRPTHLDTHKHTHLFPAVVAQLSSILRRAEFTSLRNPFEPPFAKDAAGAPLKRRLQIALLDRFRPAYMRAAHGTLTTDGTLGISATGSLNADTLQATLASLPTSGTFELLCHPGYNDADLDAIPTRLRNHREVEYRALLTQIPQLRLQPNPPQLIHYGDL